MCACMPVCFQRNLVTLAKARPAQMIFITTSNVEYYIRGSGGMLPLEIFNSTTSEAVSGGF